MKNQSEQRKNWCSFFAVEVIACSWNVFHSSFQKSACLCHSSLCPNSRTCLEASAASIHNLLLPVDGNRPSSPQDASGAADKAQGTQLEAIPAAQFTGKHGAKGKRGVDQIEDDGH